MGSTLITAPPQPALPTFSRQSPWIYRSWIDLLIGCGAWSAPLLLLAFYATTTYSRAWAVAFYFLALLCNYPHFMATVYRAYHTPTEFEKYRIFTVHIALLLALAGVIAQARAESEALLGREAAAVRRFSGATAKETLELPASSFSRPR